MWVGGSHLILHTCLKKRMSEFANDIEDICYQRRVCSKSTKHLSFDRHLFQVPKLGTIREELFVSVHQRPETVFQKYQNGSVWNVHWPKIPAVIDST